MIDRGVVKLTRLNKDGNEMILSLRSTGWIGGTASAILHRPHFVTAVTLTECHLLRVPLGVFLDLAKKNSDFCWHLHQQHSIDCYDQLDQLVGLRYLTAKQRLERLICELIRAMNVNESQKFVRLRLPLKYWEVAQLIGVTPEHLSRVLKRAEEERTILRENGSLIVTDIQKLYRASDF